MLSWQSRPLESRGDSAMYKALMSRPCASPPVGSCCVVDRSDAVIVALPDFLHGIWHVYHTQPSTHTNSVPGNAARVGFTNSSPARPTGGYGTDTIIVHVILDSTPTGSRIIRKAISSKLIRTALALNHTMGKPTDRAEPRLIPSRRHRLAQE